MTGNRSTLLDKTLQKKTYTMGNKNYNFVPVVICGGENVKSVPCH